MREGCQLELASCLASGLDVAREKGLRLSMDDVDVVAKPLATRMAPRPGEIQGSGLSARPVGRASQDNRTRPMIGKDIRRLDWAPVTSTTGVGGANAEEV